MWFNLTQTRGIEQTLTGIGVDNFQTNVVTDLWQIAVRRLGGSLAGEGQGQEMGLREWRDA